MQEYIILIKFILLLFCYTECIQKYVINTNIIIGILLFEIALPLIVYLLKNTKIRAIINAVNIIFIIFVSVYVNNIFIIVAPILSCEVNWKFPKNTKVFVIILNLLILFFVKKQYLFQYLLLNFFSVFIYYILQTNCIKLEKLRKENDIIKEENNILKKRLSRDTDYEEQLIYSSQLESRNKISQEIHDKIGHVIVGSIMQLEAVKVIMKNNYKESQNMIKNVINTLKEGHESTRITLRKIKPPKEQLDINKVKLLVKEFSKNSEIQCNLICEGNLDNVSYKYWNIIYINTKEAFTNIIKYSKATKVTVRICALNKIVKAEVKDDGVGSLKINKGIGIIGMEERVEALGGNVIVDGENGFTVVTLLPLVKKS